jgi:hypothetical protein
MKKLMMIAALMLMSVGAFAQNEIGQITVKPMAGVNIATMTNMRTAKTRIGAVAGVEGEYGFAKNFSITAGLLYSMQGEKSSDSEYSSYKYDYLNIPILANYYVYPGLALKAGMQPGIKLSAKIGDDNNDDANGFYFSFPIGASYEYSNFVFDARYNFGVSKADNPGKAKHSWFSITVGYKIPISHK